MNNLLTICEHAKNSTRFYSEGHNALLYYRQKNSVRPGGSTFTMLAGNRTFTAQWTPVVPEPPPADDNYNEKLAREDFIINGKRVAAVHFAATLD